MSRTASGDEASANVTSDNFPRERAPGATRPYHHGRLRAALVEAGLELLDASPTAELNLRELARRLDVSSAAAYRHFATREDLKSAVAAEGYRRLAAACTAARAGLAGTVAAIRVTGLAYIRFAQAHPALFRTMFGPVEPAYRTEERSAATVAALGSVYDDMARLLGLGPDDPRVALAAIHAWSHVHGLSVLLLDGKLEHGPVPEERLIELVANGYQPPVVGMLG